MRAILEKAAALGATLAAVVLVYAGFVRPWYLDWGATPAERARAMPGDEIVPGEARSTTRAVTIAAPAGAVWPWVAQLGQDRAGFYSFELLEDLVGCDMPRAQEILPGAQDWRPGDSLWMYPPAKLDGMGGAPLLAYVPGRALAFGTWYAGTAHDGPPDGSWGFVLAPADAGSTRLLVRGRGIPSAGWFATAFDHVVFEPPHFVMERRMMEGIQRFAEGRRPFSRAGDAAHVLVWMAMLAVFLWALGTVLRRRRWLGPLAIAAAAAVGFQLVTLAQPPPWLGALLAAGLAAALVRGARIQRSPEPRRERRASVRAVATTSSP
jgi:hypothetical protein